MDTQKVKRIQRGYNYIRLAVVLLLIGLILLMVQ